MYADWLGYILTIQKLVFQIVIEKHGKQIDVSETLTRLFATSDRTVFKKK